MEFSKMRPDACYCHLHKKEHTMICITKDNPSDTYCMAEYRETINISSLFGSLRFSAPPPLPHPPRAETAGLREIIINNCYALINSCAKINTTPSVTPRSVNFFLVAPSVGNCLIYDVIQFKFYLMEI